MLWIKGLLTALLIFGFCSTPAPAQVGIDAYRWQISVADGAKYGAYCSHVMLPTGQPAVSHFERTLGNLLYSWFDGLQWRTTVVDRTVRDGRFSSLVLLPTGEPAIAYLDNEKVSLKYAWKEGNRWHHTVVDASEWMHGFVSLTILPSGLPAISYKCAGLKYAWFDGTTWHTQLVDPVLPAGWCTSLAVQPSGYPAISYFWELYANHKELCYAWMDEAGWHIQILFNDHHDVCLSTSLAYLPTGEPAIGYATFYDGVGYAFRSGKGWSFDVVDAAGRFADMAIQVSGEPAITYHHPGADELRYARPASKGWDYTVVDAVEDDDLSSGQVSSLVFPPSGLPTIAYSDPSADHLKYARLDGTGAWVKVVAAQGESRVGAFSSAAVLPSGNPVAAYLDSKYNDLRYAQRVEKSWKKWVVDKAGGIGISLTVSEPGEPAISYYDNTSGDLKYAVLDGDDWKIDVVETQAITLEYDNCFTSLVFLPSGYPAVSYCAEQGGFDQKYAWFDGFEWQIQTVDDGLVWRCSSLVVLPSGEPAMTYRSYDGQEMALTYARYDGITWHKTFVDQVTEGGWGATRRENSLVVLPTGHPAVAYYDQSQDRLKYAWFNGLVWQIEIVDDEPGTGNDCSLALRPSGAPAISYTLGRDFMDLKFAWRDPVSVDPQHWKTAFVDTPNNMGTYSSLIMLPHGRPAITYFNWVGDAMMFAVGYRLTFTTPVQAWNRP